MKVGLALTILWLTLACQGQPEPPVPFEAEIADLTVRFPLTVGELLSSKQVTQRNNPVDFFTRIDSVSSYWFCNLRQYPLVQRGQTTPSDSTPLYGVVFLMPNTAAKIDSVKKLLENQLGISMSQLSIKHLNLAHESIYTLRSPVYTCVPSRGTRVSLRVGELQVGDYALLRSDVPPGGSPTNNPRKLLRVAISYGLTPDEEERFAVGSGATTWKEDD